MQGRFISAITHFVIANGMTTILSWITCVMQSVSSHMLPGLVPHGKKCDGQQACRIDRELQGSTACTWSCGAVYREGEMICEIRDGDYSGWPFRRDHHLPPPLHTPHLVPVLVRITQAAMRVPGSPLACSTICRQQNSTRQH